MPKCQLGCREWFKATELQVCVSRLMMPAVLKSPHTLHFLPPTPTPHPHPPPRRILKTTSRPAFDQSKQSLFSLRKVEMSINWRLQTGWRTYTGRTTPLSASQFSRLANYDFFSNHRGPFLMTDGSIIADLAISMA